MSKVLFPLDNFVQTGRHCECLDPTVHLGHVATAEGVSTDPEKVQAMLNLRTLRGLLKYLLEQRVTAAVQQRGLTKLLGLDYEVQYKKGSELMLYLDTMKTVTIPMTSRRLQNFRISVFL
ncbi:hypothetical protein KY289_001409 [Solanum tuberosum]|nr:hypothetical protein KY289_001409 [Solanum tuberosum]